ncbi:MAG: GspH/FimT family pseudopilin [Gammaproteobacteria bacterium]|nr:GspH/FimT family pseudopilin [Gammaproteobacteria bacterium]
MTMKTTGLTLIELIVTLAVISVLLAFGVPQFKSTTSNSRLTTSINTLSGDLAFARTEAIKRGATVTVTSGNANWVGGWTVATNVSGTVNLRITPALNPTQTLATTPATTTVTFNPDGRSNSANAIAFFLCDDRSGTFGKRVTLNPTGQTFLTTKLQCN